MDLKIWKCSQSDSLFTKEEQNDLLKRKVVCVYPDTSAKGTSSVKQGANFRNISKGDLFYLCYGNNGIILLGMFIGEKQYSQLQGKKDWLEQKYIPLFESRYKNKKYEGEKKWWTPNDNSTFVQIQNNKEFENWILHPFFSKTLDNIENELNNITKMINTQEYINLLHSTHNLILTGAPGTGKTYLAKQIAETMGCTENEIEFVQFHPSYDYTDFVEGLRPIQDDNGNVGFERKDGVFKAFCAKALENYVDSRKQENDIKEDEIFEIVYNSLYNDIDEGEISEYPTKKGLLPVFISQKKNQIVFKTKTEDKKSVKKEYLKALFNNLKDDNVDIINITKERLDERVSKVTEIEHVDHIQYRWTLDQLVSRYKKLKKETLVAKVIKQKDFVFIIDEINRGEISKIFGELFFSIDPGYRGEKGRVQTQYQNIVEDGDTFKKGFFVPENVYIIGTMNDIDRSVESMDFAMRRRFAWKEVTAEDSMQMLDGLTNADEIKARMRKINNVILLIPGFGKAYQIGAAYFKKYELYNDFDLLWEYHLEGLLLEYLRGTTDIDKNMKKLADAYGYTKSNKYEPTSNN